MEKSQPDWDVLGIGIAAVDDLIYLDHFPQPELKIPVREMLRQGGGLTATALVASARQGARAAFCSQIGADELSRFTLHELEREGVDTSPCWRTESGTPYHSIILVDQSAHTRTILFQRGVFELPPELITRELIMRCRVLFLDHHMDAAGIRAAGFARELGIPVVADVEAAQFPQREAFLAGVDHLIVSQRIARQLSGEDLPQAMTRALQSSARACTVVTGGAQGCWYAERGGDVRHVPAYPAQVVDTTGCGDVFHGVYAAALAREESVARAVHLAAASAAIKAGQRGGRAGIPGLSAVEQFLHKLPRR